MNELSTISSTLEALFQPAADQLQALISTLCSDSTGNMEHGDVEKMIKKDGTEILRNLLQSYLDLRALKETALPAIIGNDGVTRTHRRMNCSRKLMSLFGEVQVHRVGYSTKQAYAIYPLDSSLNLPADKYSHGLREMVMHEVSQHSFDEAVANIDRNTGGHVGKRQVEKLAVDLSQDFENFYEAGITNKQANVTDDTELSIVAMSIDSKGIVMRQEDLRDATKKSAERDSHKLQTRLSRGEKRNRKRMATVATVYEVGRHERSANEIMGQTKPSTIRPKIKDKRVWASVSRDATAVTNELFAEASKRIHNDAQECVVLVDGDNHQLSRVKHQLDTLAIPTTIIVDFIHVLEYLWKASYCFYNEGSEEAELWVQEKALALLNGNVSHTAAGMRRSATLQNLTKNERAAVDTCANYLLKRKNELKYDEYLASGYPIATGVIEGACRHLIKDRMDITGARWRLNGAEAILKLRSVRSSDDAQDYFKYHKQQSRLRNYGSSISANDQGYSNEKAA